MPVDSSIIDSFLPPCTPSSAAAPLAAVHYVLGLAGRVQSLLEGSPRVDPMQFGWTTEEERGVGGGGGNVSQRQPACLLPWGQTRATCAPCDPLPCPS